MIIKSNKPSKEKTKSIVYFIGISGSLADTPTEPTTITTITTSHILKK